MRPKFEEYKVMFKLQGKLTCLQGELVTSSSLGLGHPICLYHEGRWDTYISVEGEKRCNVEGTKLLGNPDSYWRWAREFRECIAQAKSEIIPHFRSVPTHLTEQEARRYIGLFQLFQDFYGVSDFPFSEGMYREYEKTKDQALGDAIEDFGKLKFEGRDILNAYMHDDGVYPSFLQGIAIQAGLEPSDGQFLFSEDVLRTTHGEKVNPKIIQQREDFYGCGFDGTFHIFTYEDSKRYWKEFHPKSTFKNELKGVVANKGIARGHVVIAPMLTDPKAIAVVIAKMNDGDVLVAESTTPEFIPLCKKASAIVTDQGGMLSHAAVVSREFNKPCIIATEVATHVLKDGDLVEVDANNGVVRVLN